MIRFGSPPVGALCVLPSKTTFVEGATFSWMTLGLAFCRGPFSSSLCMACLALRSQRSTSSRCMNVKPYSHRITTSSMESGKSDGSRSWRNESNQSAKRLKATRLSLSTTSLHQGCTNTARVVTLVHSKATSNEENSVLMRNGCWVEK